MIVANIGRFGPYIKMGNLYVNLPGDDDVHEIQMNRAVALIEEKKAGGGKGRFGRAPAPPLKELGESPVTGKPVRVLNGRYGPYITDGETNANIPKEKKPEDVTFDEALALLAARVEAGGGKKKKKAPREEGCAERRGQRSEAAREEGGGEEAPPRSLRRRRKPRADTVPSPGGRRWRDAPDEGRPAPVQFPSPDLRRKSTSPRSNGER